MRRIGSGLLVVALFAISTVPVVAAASANVVVAHASGAVGSVACAEVNGKITFSPALRTTPALVSVKVQLSSPQCSPSDATSTTSSVTLSSSQSFAALSCSSLSSTLSAFSLAAHWSPAPSSSSTVGFVGMSMTTAPTGNAAFAFPYSSSPSSNGTSLVSGPYAGTNAGHLSKMYLESGLRGSALIAGCKGVGLSSIPVVGGLITLGGVAPSFTSSSTAAFTEGSAASFPIASTTSVRAKMTWSGALPAGLTFDSSADGTSGTISGTPLVGSAGTYPVTVTVRDQNGLSSSLVLSIGVAPIASNMPIVTSVTNNDGVSQNGGAPGDSVTVSGLNIGGATSVQFNDVSVSASSATPSSVTVTVPNIAQGPYNVSVTTVAGTSPISPDSRFVQSNVPQQPPTVAAFAEGRAVHASWSANPPADHVTSYAVTLAPPSGYTGTGTPCTNATTTSVSASSTALDLATGANCVGVPYVVTMTATNAEGTSVSSSPSDVVTALPATAPNGAVITHVSTGTKSLTVFWAAPPWNGGSPLTSYDLAVGVGSVVRHINEPPLALSATVSGLTNAQSYTVTLTARNAVGSAHPSSAVGLPTAKAVPEAPNSLLVRPSGTGSGLSISWSAPLYHSSTITGYVLTVQPVDPAGVVCRSSVSQQLSSGWKDGALLHVTMPACATGFSSVLIDGASYNATLTPTKGAVAISSTSSSAVTTPTIPQGRAVVWDTMVPLGPPVVLKLARGALSASIKSLLPTNSYRVTVSATDALGIGAPIASSAPVSPTVSLARGTVALSDVTMSALSYAASDVSSQVTTYVWTSPPAQLASVHSGDTVVTPASSAGGQSSLLLVQSVTHDSAGDYVLITTPADMTDAYNTFGFSFTGSPPSNGAAHSAHGRAARVTINVNLSSGGNSAHGTISVTPWVNVSASHWCTATFWGICYQWGVSATASAGINASENLVLALTGSTSIEIFSCTVQNGCMPNIIFWIGPIPVQISPSVAVTLELSGNVNITSNASASWSGWISYNSQGNSFTHGSAHNFTAAPGQNTANGTAHASLDLTFQLCAYGNVLCGHVTGSAAVDLVFNTAVVSPANYLTVTCGFSVTAGFDVHIFGWNPSGSATLISYSTQCYHIVAAAGIKVLTIAPVGLGGYPANTVPLGANIVTLSATRNDLATPSLTWTLLNPVTGQSCGDSITSLGHLSTACVGGNRTLTIRAVDSSSNPALVATRSIVVQSGFVFNPPPAPVVFQFQAGFSQIHQATLILTPPPNSGGYPMAFYYVHFSCPVLSWQGYGIQGVWDTYSGPTTVLQVTTFGLLPCTIQVWPIISNGAWGPSITTVALI